MSRQCVRTVAKPYINPPVAMITKDTKKIICTQRHKHHVQVHSAPRPAI